MTTHIKTFISSLIQSQKNWKIDLLHQWKDIVGVMHTQVSIEKITDDTLILQVADSCWLQELYLLSPVLLKQINEKLDRPRIKQLRFKHAGRPVEKNKKSALPKDVTRKVVVFTPAEHQALCAVKDDQLRASLEAFLIRCYQEK
jgi:hypothetical protein